MRMTRRHSLIAMAGSCASLLISDASTVSKRSRLGIVIYAMGIHEKNNWNGRRAGLPPALAFLEECHELGAGGIQCPLRSGDAQHLAELRRRLEKYEMHFEAIVDPPRDNSDLARFENDIVSAKEAGAGIGRTVVMPGRRYEQFKTLDEFREYEARGLKALQLSEPLLSKHRFRLAVENHKDQRASENLAMLKKLSSEWIGLCFDIANNFALMEDPLESARELAPYAFTVHIKDMLVKEYKDGWLIADVALGDGFLNVKTLVSIIRSTKPEVRFNLETITREAIKLPLYTDAFWTTIPGDRTQATERARAVVQSKSGGVFPENPVKLAVQEQLAMERRHLERSLVFAREQLDI